MGEGILSVVGDRYSSAIEACSTSLAQYLCAGETCLDDVHSRYRRQWVGVEYFFAITAFIFSFISEREKEGKQREAS